MKTEKVKFVQIAAIPPGDGDSCSEGPYPVNSHIFALSSKGEIYFYNGFSSDWGKIESPEEEA